MGSQSRYSVVTRHTTAVRKSIGNKTVFFKRIMFDSVIREGNRELIKLSFFTNRKSMKILVLIKFNSKQIVAVTVRFVMKTDRRSKIMKFNFDGMR